MENFDSSNFSVEEYRVACKKKFDLDNTMYERLIPYLQSGHYVNGLTQAEKKFYRRKAAKFQWDASEKTLYYTGSSDGKRRQVVRSVEELANVFTFHHSNATSGH